jgi:peptide/nickel transport system permease protein
VTTTGVVPNSEKPNLVAPARKRAARPGRAHPIGDLVARRLAAGVITLVIVSIVVFAATQVLPGNAAYAILGRDANPVRLHAMELQLHLDRSPFDQYVTWLGGLLAGNPGHSLANGQPVWAIVAPRLVNSAVLVAVSGVVGALIGVFIGAVAALRKDKLFDHVLSIVSLVVTALPEFVVAISLVILFATVAFQVLPAVSNLPPGTYAWQQPDLLVLPVATLVIVIFPYIFRMMRGAMIEALESDYVEMARLKGLPVWRVLLVHALPNALPPTIQVIGLNLLYLAGGIVVVEYVFDFPGIGQGLVSAVSNRDIPVIQLIVVILAAFYVFMNILTDVVALLATPRRRIAR